LITRLFIDEGQSRAELRASLRSRIRGFINRPAMTGCLRPFRRDLPSLGLSCKPVLSCGTIIATMPWN